MGNRLLKPFAGILFGATAYKSYISIVDRSIVSGTNFLTLVVVGRVCGLENLGIFALAWTILLTVNAVQEAFILSPFTVFAGEITRTITGEITGENQRKSYAGAILAMLAILVAAASILTLVGIGVVTNIISDPVIHATGWFLLLAIPAVSLREFVRRYLFAKLAAFHVLMLDAAVAVLQFAGLGLFWYYDLLSAGSTLLLISIATGLPAIVWLGLNFSQFKIPEKAEFTLGIHRHWSFGRWNCAAQMSDLAVTHGIAWLIALTAGTAATGIFAACNSLVMVINPLLFGIGSILLPHAAQANHRHGRDEVARIVWKATGILALSVGVLCLLVAWQGENLIGIFYSLESVDGVREVIILLALANFIGATSFAIDNGLMVVNRQDVNFAASLTGFIVTFLTAIVLASQLGLVGIVSGVLIGGLINAVIQVVAFSRLVGKPRLFSTAHSEQN